MKKQVIYVIMLILGITSHIQGSSEGIEKFLEQHQEKTRQFLKQVTENELDGLTIAKPDIKALITKAKKGDAEAQYNLAVIYMKGSWLPKDENKKNRWMLESAKQGHLKSKRWLYSGIYSKLDMIKTELTYKGNKAKLPEDKRAKLSQLLQNLFAYNEQAFTGKPARDKSNFDKTYHNIRASLATEIVTETANESPKYAFIEERYWAEAKKGDIDELFWLWGSHRDMVDMPERLSFIIKAAELGHIEAQHELGLLNEMTLDEFEYGTGEHFYRKIFPRYTSKEQCLLGMAKWYGKAGNAGHLEAQVKTGDAELKSGNFDGALKWYMKAAKSGEAKAIDGYRSGILNLMREEGMETKCLEALSSIIEERKDFGNDVLESIAFQLADKGANAKYCKQAVEIYELVAETLDSLESGFLGGIYSQEKGCLCEGAFKKNVEKAIYWYKKGDRRQELASLYFTEKEYSKAFDIFKKLAEEDRDKCTRYAYWALGNCYYEGLGTVKNYYKAYKWFLVYKYYDSKYSIGFAETKLSADMISKAQHEAAEFVEILKHEDEESKRKFEARREQIPTYSTGDYFITRWIESLEKISQLLAKALPNENIPTDFSWIISE